MYDAHVFDSRLALASSVVCTLVVSFVFLMMSFSYTRRRSNQKYALGKVQAPSIASFNTLSKVLFVASMLLTLFGYWFAFDLIPAFHQQPFLQMLGAGLVVVGYFNLNRAFNHLGNNYSPLFDAYQPDSLVTNGAYRRIRHPIYLFNLLVSFGLVISSGSLLVLLFALTGLVFVMKAIYLEEAYLLHHFSEYREYVKHTWKLIPYIF